MKKVRLESIMIGILFLVLLGLPGNSGARVDINIGITPPALVINGPPEVAIIPGTYVYFCSDVEADLFFYDGYWYRPYEGRWFRSASYSGPWVFIESPPQVLISLPHDFRARSGYRRIPYRELSANWRTWQRDKYWEKHGWGRAERNREREHGVAPSYNRGGEREREHGVAPSFKGGERQNRGGSREMERRNPGRSNESGRQNMNKGGHGREER